MQLGSKARQKEMDGKELRERWGEERESLQVEKKKLDSNVECTQPGKR